MWLFNPPRRMIHRASFLRFLAREYGIPFMRENSSRISLTAAYSIEEGGGEGEKLLIGRMDSRSRLRTLHAYENYGQSSDSSSSTRASTRKLPTVFRSNIFTLCCGSRARPFSCKPPRISKKRDSETIGERNILKEKERKKPIDLANLRIMDLSILRIERANSFERYERGRNCVVIIQSDGNRGQTVGTRSNY